jgi:hypothetical protein
MGKSKYGHMVCHDCPEKVVVKVNEHGTLSYTCEECDAASYCKQGAGNRSAWEGRITKVAGSAPAPKPDDKKTDDKKPAEKKGIWA